MLWRGDDHGKTGVRKRVCDMAGISGRDALGKGHPALQVFDAIAWGPLHAFFQKESISEGGLRCCSGSVLGKQSHHHGHSLTPLSWLSFRGTVLLLADHVVFLYSWTLPAKPTRPALPAQGWKLTKFPSSCSSRGARLTNDALIISLSS